MTIVILILIAIVAVSLLLTLRSMQNYEENPKPSLNYSLFLIRNEKAFNKENLYKLYQYAVHQQAIISLERLFKGSQTVLTIYAPTHITNVVPEWHLLELEDYLQDLHKAQNNNIKATKLDHTLGWNVNKRGRNLQTSKSFLKNLPLTSDQSFYLQVVLYPALKSFGQYSSGMHLIFQSTLRSMVAETDAQRRVELAKVLDKYIKEDSNLIRDSKEKTTKSIFNSFKKRTIYPSQVREFKINEEQLLSLLGIK